MFQGYMWKKTKHQETALTIITSIIGMHLQLVFIYPETYKTGTTNINVAGRTLY